MPEQALNGVDVDAGFQQMGGETVAQGVDTAVPPQAGTIACRAIDALRCLRINRPGVRGVGEQPNGGVVIAPILAQAGQQGGREHGVAILAALARAAP